MKQILKLCLLSLLFINQTAKSQTPFVGMYSTSFTTNPSGPAFSTPPAKIQRYNSGSPIDPIAGALTVSAAFTSQVYNTELTPGFGDKGLMFGVSNNNSVKAYTPSTVGVPLANVGGPSNSYYSPTVAQLGSGMNAYVNPNYAFNMFTSAEALAVRNPQGIIIGSQPTDGRYEFGLVTFTFSRAVNNPIIHVTGLGGFLSTPEPAGNPTTLPFATELELMNAYSMTRLSGSSKFSVAGTLIKSSYTGADYLATFQTPESGDNAGTGSVVINGTNILSVTFKVWLRGLIAGQLWTSNGSFINQVYNGDRYNVSWTLPDISQTTLPISGAQLKASLNNNDVNLTWSTQTELNSKEFEIERSSDGVNFTKIQTKAAAGNSASERSYNHVDPAMSSKVYFYRLKMVDLDGKYSYSNIAVVRKVNVRGIKTFPNPVTSQINVEFNGSKGSYVISVLNQAGQEMNSVRVVITNDVQYASIKRGTLAAGMYFIRVQNVNDASDNFIQKLIVQ